MSDIIDSYSLLQNMLPTTDNSYNSNLYETTNSSFLDKYNDIQNKLEMSYAAAEVNKIQKELDLTGYKQGYLLSPKYIGRNPLAYDADSGTIQDIETGQMFGFRGNAYNNVDSIDTLHDVLKSRNKSFRQPKVVAQLTGKNVNQLTADDFNNVDRYQSEQFIKSLSDPNYKFEKYDNSRKYTGIEFDKIPILYKVNGKGFYGRDLIDIVNPNTGKSVYEQMSNNPYLNTDFNLTNTIDTPENRERLEQFRSISGKKFQNILNSEGLRVKDFTDRFGTSEEEFGNIFDYMGFLADRVSSNSRQMLARVMKRIPGADNDYWAKWLVEDESGMTLADHLAGVDPKQFALYKKRMLKDQKLFEKGEYVKAIGSMATHLLDYLADSLPQMGAMVAGTALGAATGGGLAALTGGTFLRGLGAYLAGSSVVATDETLMAIEDFEKEHPGQKMSGSNIANLFMQQLAVAVPEVLLSKVGLKKILPESLGGKLFGKDLNIEKVVDDFSLGKHIAVGTAGEFGQETTQSGISKYFRENGDKDFDIIKELETFSDPDVLYEGTAGALMGGALSTISGGIGKFKNVRTQKQYNEAVRQENERQAKVDINSTVVSQEKQDAAKESLKLMDEYVADPTKAVKEFGAEAIYNQPDKQAVAFSEAYYTIKKLNDIKNSTPTLEVLEKVGAKQAEISKKLFNDIRSSNLSEEDKNAAIDDFIKISGMSKEDIFDGIVRHSHLNNHFNLMNNEKPSNDIINQEKDELRKIGSLLQLGSDFVERTMEEVNDQLYSGVEGLRAASSIIRYSKENLLQFSGRPDNTLTKEEKARKNQLLANYIGAASRYEYLRQLNANKIRDIAKGFNELAQNPMLAVYRNNWESGEGKGIYIQRDDIPYVFGERVGIFKVIDNIVKDVEYMNEHFDSEVDPKIRTMSQNLVMAREKAKGKNDWNVRDTNQIMQDIQTNLNSINFNTAKIIEDSVKGTTPKPASSRDVNKHANNILDLARKPDDWKFREKNLRYLQEVSKNPETWNKVKERATEFANKPINADYKERILNTISLIENNNEAVTKNQQQSQELETKAKEDIANLTNTYNNDFINDLVNRKPKNTYIDPDEAGAYSHELNNTITSLENTLKQYENLHINDEETNKNRNNLALTLNSLKNISKQLNEQTENEKAQRFIFNDLNKAYEEGNVKFSKIDYFDKEEVTKESDLVKYDSNNDSIQFNKNNEAWISAAENHIWTNEQEFKDGSKLPGLPEDAFSNINAREYQSYITELYIQHKVTPKKDNETEANYWKRLQNKVLGIIDTNDKSDEEDKTNEDVLEGMSSTGNEQSTQDVLVAEKYANDPEVSWLFDSEWGKTHKDENDPKYLAWKQRKHALQDRLAQAKNIKEDYENDIEGLYKVIKTTEAGEITDLNVSDKVRTAYKEEISEALSKAYSIMQKHYSNDLKHDTFDEINSLPKNEESANKVADWYNKNIRDSLFDYDKESLLKVKEIISINLENSSESLKGFFDNTLKNINNALEAFDRFNNKDNTISNLNNAQINNQNNSNSTSSNNYNERFNEIIKNSTVQNINKMSNDELRNHQIKMEQLKEEIENDPTINTEDFQIELNRLNNGIKFLNNKLYPYNDFKSDNQKSTFHDNDDKPIFLSNFYESPVTIDGITYKNAEAAFQAGKVPPEQRKQFSTVEAKAAKTAGKRVSMSPEALQQWNSTGATERMKAVLKAKFSDPELRQQLLDTGNAELTERNKWGDKLWGQVKQEGKWVGENRLGKLLMELRDELKNENNISNTPKKYNFKTAQDLVKDTTEATKVENYSNDTKGKYEYLKDNTYVGYNGEVNGVPVKVYLVNRNNNNYSIVTHYQGKEIILTDSKNLESNKDIKSYLEERVMDYSSELQGLKLTDKINPNDYYSDYTSLNKNNHKFNNTYLETPLVKSDTIGTKSNRESRINSIMSYLKNYYSTYNYLNQINTKGLGKNTWLQTNKIINSKLESLRNLINKIDYDIQGLHEDKNTFYTNTEELFKALDQIEKDLKNKDKQITQVFLPSITTERTTNSYNKLKNRVLNTLNKNSITQKEKENTQLQINRLRLLNVRNEEIWNIDEKTEIFDEYENKLNNIPIIKNTQKSNNLLNTFSNNLQSLKNRLNIINTIPEVKALLEAIKTLGINIKNKLESNETTNKLLQNCRNLWIEANNKLKSLNIKNEGNNNNNIFPDLSNTNADTSDTTNDENIWGDIENLDEVTAKDYNNTKSTPKHNKSSSKTSLKGVLEESQFNEVKDLLLAYNKESLDYINDKNRIETIKSQLEKKLEAYSKNTHPDMEQYTNEIKNLISYINETIIPKIEANSESEKKFKSNDTRNKIFNPGINHNLHILPSSNNEEAKIKEAKTFVIYPKDFQKFSSHIFVRNGDTVELKKVTKENREDTEFWNSRIPFLFNSIKFTNPESTLAYNVDEFLNMKVKGSDIGLGSLTVNSNDTATIREFLNTALAEYKQITKEFILNNYNYNGERIGDSLQVNFISNAPHIAKYLQQNPFLQVLFQFHYDKVYSNKLQNYQYYLRTGSKYENETNEFDLNENTLGVMLYTLIQSTRVNDISTTFKRNEDGNLSASLEDVARMHSLDYRNGLAVELHNAYRIHEEYGMPLQYYQNSLGALFLKNLGIIKNNLDSGYMYEGFKSGAGNAILTLAKALGMININKYDADKYIKQNNLEDTLPKDSSLRKTMNMIQVTPEGINQFERMSKFFKNGLDERFNIAKNKEHKLNFDKITYSNTEQFVKRTDGLYRIPSRMFRQMKLNSKLENVANMDIFDELIQTENDEENYLDAFFKNHFKLLSTELRNNASKDALDTDEGRTQSVDLLKKNLKEALSQIQAKALEDGIDPKDVVFFHKYFISSNMRYMIVNNLINPQSSKVDRWFFPQKNWLQKYSFTNNDDIKYEKFAMAQAFDLLKEESKSIDAAYDKLCNMSVEDLRTMFHDFCTMGDSFSDKYNYSYINNKGETITVNYGIESPAQTLHVITHFLKRAEAKANGQEYVESYLAVENDATTSGYCIKGLNIPLPYMLNDKLLKSIDDNVYLKLGIIVGNNINGINNKPMHEIKTLNGFLDIYKTAGKLLYERLTETLTDKASVMEAMKKSLGKKDNTKLAKIPSNNCISFVDHTELYEIVKPLLPVAEIDKTEGDKVYYKVTSALRSLLKPAVMVMNYTAGLHSISCHLANHIMQEILLPSYLSDKIEKNSTQYKSLESFFNYFKDRLIDKNGNHIKNVNIKDLFKKNSVYSIRVRIDNVDMSIGDAFEAVIEATYGQAAWDGLNTIFEPYRAINNSLNELGAIQYTNFIEEYEAGIHELENKYINKVTGKIDIPYFAMKNLIKSLQEQYPAIDLYYDENRNITGNQVMLLNRQRSLDKNTLFKGWDIPTSREELNARIKANIDEATSKEENLEVRTLGDHSKQVKVRVANVLNLMYLRPEIYTYASPRLKSAVLGVHSTDGTIMTYTMEFINSILNNKTTEGAISFLGVHDAFVSSAKHADIIPFLSNAFTLDINKNWDMFKEMLNKTEDQTLRHLLKYNETSKKLFTKFKEESNRNGILTQLNYEDSTDIDAFLKNLTDEKKHHLLQSYLEFLRDYYLPINYNKDALFEKIQSVIHKTNFEDVSNILSEEEKTILTINHLDTYDVDKLLSNKEYVNYLKSIATDNEKTIIDEAVNYPVHVYRYPVGRRGAFRTVLNYRTIFDTYPGAKTNDEILNKTDLITDLNKAYDFYHEGVYYNSSLNKVKTNIDSIESLRRQLWSQNIQGANIDSATALGTYFYSPNTDSIGHLLSHPIMKDYLIDLINQQAGREIIRKASMRGFISAGNREYLLTNAYSNPQARIDLVKTLNEQSKAENLPYLKDNQLNDLLELLQNINPKALEDLAVTIEAHAFNTGEIKEKTKTIRLGLDNKSYNINSSGYSNYSDMPIAEVLTHEYVHAGLIYANSYKDEYGIRDSFEKARLLQKYVFDNDIIKPSDLIDSNIENQAIARKLAEEKYQHMWSNPNQDTKNDEALNEFLAIASTNARVREILANTRTSLFNNKDTILNNIIKLVKEIFKAIFMKSGSFKNVITSANELINGIKFKNNQTLLDDLNTLRNRLTNADNLINKRLMQHPLAKAEIIWNSLARIKNYGNDKLVPLVDTLTDFFKPFNNPQTKLEKIRTKLFFKIAKGLNSLHSKFSPTVANALYLSANALIMPFSKANRTAILHILKEFKNLNEESFAKTVIRDMQNPDYYTTMLEHLALQRGEVDKAAKGMEYTVRMDLEDSFTPADMTERSQETLTRVALMGDLQCLLDPSQPLVSSIKDLKKLVNDQDLIKEKIKGILDKLESTVDKNDNNAIEAFNFIKNQCHELGYYMAVGLGNEALNKNAHNIATMNFLDKAYFVYARTKEKDKKLINQLASLYSLKFMSDEYKQELNNISDKGLENFLNVHRTFINETSESFKYIDHKTLDIKEQSIFDNENNGVTDTYVSNIQKGYFKRMYNPDNEVVINAYDNKTIEYMAKKGFKPIELDLNRAVNKKAGMYLRKVYADQERRDGSAYVMIGARRIGTSLNETAEAFNVDTSTLVLDADKRHEKILKVMLKVKDPEKCHKLINSMTNGAVPIARNKLFRREKNRLVYTTKPMDYTYTGSHKLHKDILEMNMNATDILSRMYATNTTKAQSYLINDNLLHFLYTYQDRYCDPNTHLLTVSKTDSKYGTKFIELREDTDNKFLKEAWRSIPLSFKKATKHKPLYIREDWILSLCGVPNFSLGGYLQSKVKETPDNIKALAMTKKATDILELMLKLISAQAKKIIVIGKPIVLISNILSNFLISLARFNNPLKLISMQLRTAADTVKYAEDRKEYYKLQFKERKGTSNDKDRANLKFYKAKLENNPVHPLMQAGMFQNIIEDIRESDLDKTGRPYRFLKKLGLIDKLNQLPNTIKAPGSWLWRNVTLANNSGIYKLLYGITQYSDFVARATEYRMRMNPNYQVAERDINGKLISRHEIPKKILDDGSINPEWYRYEFNVRNDVLQTFINYDKPHSQFEHYMNDIGLFMFTKFFKRIQPIIYNTVKGNPMGSLMTLLSQSLLADTDDIYEQHFINKHYSAMLHNPFENLMLAAMPWGLQVASGNIDLIPSPFKHN